MTLTKEDMSAISQMLDTKLDARFEPIEEHLEKIDARFEPIEEHLEYLDETNVKFDAKFNSIDNRLRRIEVDLLENNVIPRLNTIETCYTSTYDRYKDYADKMDTAFTDIELLKKVVSEHSEKLQKLA